MRKLTEFLIICLLAAPLVAQSAPGKADLADATALLVSGKPAEAETILRTLLAAHPDSVGAFYLLADSLYQQDRAEEALKTFEKAAGLRAPNSDQLTTIARVYIRLADAAKAQAALERALSLNDHNTEARYQLGRVLYKTGDLDRAIDSFELVVKAQPQRIGALDNLGLTLERKGFPDRAIEAYGKAIKADVGTARHSERPYLNLGTLLVKLGRYEEAVPLLNQALYRNPKCFSARSALGQAYLSLQRLEDSQREIELAVSLNPSDSAAHYFLGRLYTKLSKTELAAREFQVTRELTHKEKSRGASMGMGKEVDMPVE
jgi:tetratricopeptide (TPR) repeat protein